MAARSPRLIAGAVAISLLAAGLAAAATVQTEGVRVTVLGQIMPYKLPRIGTAPIAVFVGGHLENPDGGLPPQLRRMKIRVNRHGLLQSRGLPVCRPAEIFASTTQRALEVCAPALIGSGQFWANIVLSGQPPYPTHGRILIFNGRSHGRPTVLAQIYTADPFDSSFVIVFSVKRIHEGPWGTELSASLPQALGSWGYLDRIKLTLKRTYTRQGRQLSYFNAGCPAAKGTSRAAFPLARAQFFFAARKPIATTVTKSCGVRE